jgi:hypothetical protein
MKLPTRSEKDGEVILALSNFLRKLFSPQILASSTVRHESPPDIPSVAVSTSDLFVQGNRQAFDSAAEGKKCLELSCERSSRLFRTAGPDRLLQPLE